jgi:hypothetical protein
MPSSPGYIRKYKQEDARDKARGKVGTGHNSDTAVRERDRRKALKLGLIKKSQTLDHIKPLSKGGGESPSNWRGETPHDNYSYPRNKDGSMIVNRSPTKGAK